MLREHAYGGVLSAGIGYTLQIVSQRHCPPAHTAVILSLETVFATLAGWIILHETLGIRALIGCALMLSSLMIVQLSPILSRRREKNNPPLPVDHPLGQ
ncbi:MAG: EamA family transporter [Planctomycetes bacterium]|nr:EamA family transporter [Planctomycetota bacterium]